MNMDRLAQFFSDRFYTPHGFCLLWLPEIVWLHVIADALIAFSYFSIPLALWHFSKKRPDMPFNKVLLLFATFITLCGLTHIVGIIVLWHPYYGLEGLLMLVTGLVSMATAVFVWRMMPAALHLPSPSRLEAINKELSASYEEIEQKVRDRTQELEATTREMIEARLKADKASEAKSEFLANMSHEIRTPMNAIIGISDIFVTNNELSPKQEELMKTLQLSANSLLSLINDLLDISKIESQNVELERVPLSITDVVNDAVNIMGLKASEKGLNFTCESHCEDIHLRKFIGDPNRLRQIVINLSNNAIKFTENGSVIIRLNCEKTKNPEIENIIIEVQDTGIGIPEDKLDIIFEKFIQADSSINRRYGGSGLGLAITKQLVEAMGGLLTVKSKINTGSTFKLFLPMLLSNDQSIAKYEKIESPEKVSNAQAGTILLVEDYAANILVTTTLLDEFGYAWDTAKNGIEAIKKFKENKYSLILMDVEMPELNGLDATRAIRKHEQDHHLTKTPIMAMTAHAQPGDREKCILAGMDDYISKPFKRDDLKRKIHDLRK